MPSSGGQTCALPDRKSTRLNSSHTIISDAVFCLEKRFPPPSAWTGRDMFTSPSLTIIRSAKLRLMYFFLMMRRPPRSTLFPLHDALPISSRQNGLPLHFHLRKSGLLTPSAGRRIIRSEEHTSELQSHDNLVCRLLLE